MFLIAFPGCSSDKMKSSWQRLMSLTWIALCHGRFEPVETTQPGERGNHRNYIALVQARINEGQARDQNGRHSEQSGELPQGVLWVGK